jgi:hypothetical protein
MRSKPSETTRTVAAVSEVDLAEYVERSVEAERHVVAARLDELRAQSDRLRRLVEQVDADAEQTARLLRQIDESLGIAPQLSLSSLAGELRGQELQEVAVALLREKRSIGEPVHYREWYGMLLEAGARVAGKDHLATFLTQVARAAAVESVKPRSGLYRLVTA